MINKNMVSWNQTQTQEILHLYHSYYGN